MKMLFSGKFKGVEWAMQQIEKRDKRIKELEADYERLLKRATGNLKRLIKANEAIEELEATIERVSALPDEWYEESLAEQWPSDAPNASTCGDDLRAALKGVQ